VGRDSFTDIAADMTQLRAELDGNRHR